MNATGCEFTYAQNTVRFDDLTAATSAPPDGFNAYPLIVKDSTLNGGYNTPNLTLAITGFDSWSEASAIRFGVEIVVSGNRFVFGSALFLGGIFPKNSTIIIRNNVFDFDNRGQTQFQAFFGEVHAAIFVSPFVSSSANAAASGLGSAEMVYNAFTLDVTANTVENLHHSNEFVETVTFITAHFWNTVFCNASSLRFSSNLVVRGYFVDIASTIVAKSYIGVNLQIINGALRLTQRSSISC